MINPDELRRAMSRFATGVTVVTTLDHAGKVHGMTANAFTSVCLDPPMALVCIAHLSHTHGFVEASGKFGVNVLRADQKLIAQYFAKSPENRHGEADYSCTISAGGYVALDGSLVFFSCRVVGTHEYGDHTVFVAEVEQMDLGAPAEPLIFFEGCWMINQKS